MNSETETDPRCSNNAVDDHNAGSSSLTPLGVDESGEEGEGHADHLVTGAQHPHRAPLTPPKPSRRAAVPRARLILGGGVDGNSGQSKDVSGPASLLADRNMTSGDRQHILSAAHEGGRDAPDAPRLRQFWRTYDQVIILSISSVLGIMFRAMSATWFRMELGSVFSEDSALGTNLPLNTWSCFLMGLLCSGREAMGIVQSKALGGANPYGSGRGILDAGRGAYRGVIDAGRAGMNRVRGFGHVLGSGTPSPPDDARADSSSGGNSPSSRTGLRRRQAEAREACRLPPGNIMGNHESDPQQPGPIPRSAEFQTMGSRRDGEDEIRSVQLRGLTRRIIASPSLALFPARKEGMDVMEHYEGDPSPFSHRASVHEDLFEIDNLDNDVNVDLECDETKTSKQMTSTGEASGEASGQPRGLCISPQLVKSSNESPGTSLSNASNGFHGVICHHTSIEGQVDEVIHSISENVTTLRRMRHGDGWNVDTSPEKMKHIILLGLRVGFCGALSTFSSLNASVIRLLRSGSVGEALVGYGISVQLGILSYRFGQHLAVYVFVWRCRREARRDEERGYGLRLSGADAEGGEARPERGLPSDRQCVAPSVRTVATLLFLAMLVSLCLAIYLVPGHQQYICSLLFTPFGCLARWKLMNKYNEKVPGFALGTFICNLLSCALSGSLGSFLAGNPGPEESILLTSMIAGFAGSLSTFATFIVEILSLIDPIIFKFDGFLYAVITILWAVMIGLASSQAKNWADEI